MQIRYDVEKIKSIISDFSNITGISMSLLDTEFNWIATFAHNSPAFCEKIRSHKKGDILCYQSDLDILKKCRKAKGFVSHTCHAGIIDSAMPLMKNGIISGYIIFGRIRPAKDVDEICKNIAWLGEDPDDLRESYMKISYYNAEQILSMSRLVSEILFANAIVIELDEPLKTAVAYIENNLAEDLSLERLCSVCHASKNMLYKCFRDTFGTTVNRYVTEKRLTAATRRIENSDTPIYKIAEDVGINNYTYFCKLFRKHTSVSPSEYRKDLRRVQCADAVRLKHINTEESGIL
ncbi:MAG: helix-turn-helix domain-containing protein [Ruminococcaceae bacterium]|nr:helix-turn-helix domain-containing protein [Oscillospiraceae bacterium]